MFESTKFRFLSVFAALVLTFGASAASAQAGAPDELAPDALDMDEDPADAEPVDSDAGEETAASDQNDPAENAPGEAGDEGSAGDPPPAQTDDGVPPNTGEPRDQAGGAEDVEPAPREESAGGTVADDQGELPEPELGAAAVGGAFGAGFAATGIYGALATVFGLVNTVLIFALPASAFITPPWSSIALALSLLSCTNGIGACLTMPAVVGGGVTAAGNALSDYEASYIYTILASYVGCWGLGLVNLVIGIAVSLVATALFPPTTQGGTIGTNPVASAIGLGVGVVSGGLLIGLGVPAIAAGTWYASAEPKAEFQYEEQDDIGETEYVDEYEDGEYEDGEYEDDGGEYEDEYEDGEYEDEYEDEYDDAAQRGASMATAAQAF